MEDPVIVSDSQGDNSRHYDKGEILKWLETHATDPIGRNKIDKKMMIHDRELQREIIAFVEKCEIQAVKNKALTFKQSEKFKLFSSQKTREMKELIRNTPIDERSRLTRSLG